MEKNEVIIAGVAVAAIAAGVYLAKLYNERRQQRAFEKSMEACNKVFSETFKGAGF